LVLRYAVKSETLRLEPRNRVEASADGDEMHVRKRTPKRKKQKQKEEGPTSLVEIFLQELEDESREGLLPGLERRE
jgi:hypothetical protein